MQGVYEPACKGFVDIFHDPSKCLSNNTSHVTLDEMVASSSAVGMACPTPIWFTTAKGKRLPRLLSRQLLVRFTQSPSTWDISKSHSRSLHTTDDISVIKNCQGFPGERPRRPRYFPADIFRGRLQSRRLQAARDTRPSQFKYFFTTRPLHYGSSTHSAHLSTQQEGISSTDLEAQSDDSQSLAGLCVTTRKLTTCSEGENACAATMTEGSRDGEPTTKASRLPFSGWPLFSDRSSTVVLGRWLFKGSSPLLLNRGAVSDEGALLSLQMVSALVLLSRGVGTRRCTCSASIGSTSTSQKMATLASGRPTPLLWSHGDFRNEFPDRSCFMRQDPSVARNPLTASPMGLSICGFEVKKFPQIFKVTSQRRFFGGRAGGLKRRKPKKDPGVVVQTGLGRRQEFFWPVEARRTRVPLYQNSRPNLIFDQRFKRFMCMWYSNGIQVFRPFSCRGRRGGRGKHGAPDGLGIGKGSGTWERARAKAVALLKQLQEQGNLKNLPKPDICRSGVRGVYFDSEEKLWVATWNEHGLRRFKAFPTVEMGFDAAYQAAVAVRRQKLLENYVFCMQRNRKKSGRLPLK